MATSTELSLMTAVQVACGASAVLEGGGGAGGAGGAAVVEGGDEGQQYSKVKTRFVE